MVEFGGWEMPLSYPAGTIEEHLACRRDAVVFDVSHLGSVRVDGDGALDRLQLAFTNDLGKIEPGRAQYTHLLDDADASVLDDIIVWWHPSATGADVFDVMPNASNTERVLAAVGGAEITHERAVLAVQGPHARERLADVSRRRPTCVASGSRTVRGTECRARWPARDTQVSRASRSPCRASRQWISGRRSWRPASGPPVSARATRCASKRRCRCTETSSGPASRLFRPVSAGWLRGANLSSAAGARWPKSTSAGPTAGSSASPPRAGGRREHGCAVLVEDHPRGEVTSGNYSPVLEHGIALAFVEPAIAEETAVTIDVRGSALTGTVVPTPFVGQ